MAIPLSARGASHLECTGCGAAHESERLQRVSTCCGKPLFARYDLDRIRTHFRPMDLERGRPANLWRFAEVLPVRDPHRRLSLGEGFTPLLPVRRLGRDVGHDRLWIKDEGANPTGSFKARGLAVAVARAAELGAPEVLIPSAGNAAAAAAAYAAAAGLRCRAVVPADAPAPILAQTVALGAELERVDGLITDAGAQARELAETTGAFDLSTLREPYRVEGKKTMGYELFEQLGRLPDVIVYPTGGGTGLVGMWKAFEEMERLGWIGPERPRMIVVQAEGCAPMVRAWKARAERAEPWENARTDAAGLRVPSAIGDFLILRTLYDSGGEAVAVSDQAMRRAVSRIGRATGVFASLEGAASLAALLPLLDAGRIRPDEDVVLFNTGSGLTAPGLAAPGLSAPGLTAPGLLASGPAASGPASPPG